MSFLNNTITTTTIFGTTSVSIILILNIGRIKRSIVSNMNIIPMKYRIQSLSISELVSNLINLKILVLTLFWDSILVNYCYFFATNNRYLFIVKQKICDYPWLVCKRINVVVCIYFLPGIV